MKNVSKILKDIIEFENFAGSRGYELIMARGCPWKVYPTPDFDFEEDKIVMRFNEDTYSDCTDYRDISLKVEDLEKTDEEWSSYIEEIKKQTSERKEKERQEKENRDLELKRAKFEALKKELGL